MRKSASGFRSRVGPALTGGDANPALRLHVTRDPAPRPLACPGDRRGDAPPPPSSRRWTRQKGLIGGSIRQQPIMIGSPYQRARALSGYQGKTQRSPMNGAETCRWRAARTDGIRAEGTRGHYRVAVAPPHWSGPVHRNMFLCFDDFKMKKSHAIGTPDETRTILPL